MASEEKLKELEEIYRRLQRKVAAEWNRCHEPGISPSQIYLLETLECTGPQKASDLAEEMGISLPAVTGLSDKLVLNGFAERQRSEGDRRVVLLKITEKGSEFLKGVREQRRYIMQKFYQGLSDEDIDHLIRIYGEVLRNIQTRGME